MSTTIGFLTIPLPAASLPKTVSDLSDVSMLFDPATSLGGGSCKGVVFGMIELIAADQGLVHLGHLSEKAATLSPAQLPAAIDDLQRILSHWREEPDAPLRITRSDFPPAAEILALLDQPASLQPENDDWDDVPFLIAVLKGHLSVLLSAKANGQWIVHAKS